VKCRSAQCALRFGFSFSFSFRLQLQLQYQHQPFAPPKPAPAMHKKAGYVASELHMRQSPQTG
jgi:hypothetical protein